MRIYFVGAHSTGKTTMTRWVSSSRGLPMISEVARAVLAELEAPLERLRTDPILVEKYQRLIFERQIETEKKAGESFVSDRAFDNLAYAAEHTTIVADIIDSQDFRDYMKWVSEGLVFFLRPNRRLLREDGTRETTYWESVVRIDGMVKLLLEQYRVPYLPIESASMQERIRSVSFVLSQFKELKKGRPGALR